MLHLDLFNLNIWMYVKARNTNIKIQIDKTQWISDR